MIYRDERDSRIAALEERHKLDATLIDKMIKEKGKGMTEKNKKRTAASVALSAASFFTYTLICTLSTCNAQAPFRPDDVSLNHPIAAAAVLALAVCIAAMFWMDI